MKLITFCVPSYNSEAYMKRCIDTLLTGGKEVEIIIVNDGSTDRTGYIADQYAEDYPDIIRVIHQENKGHGGGVNAGLREAKGFYYKVVDSDDWLNVDALRQVIMKIKEFQRQDKVPDLLVCNYIYNHLYENKIRQVNYRNIFEQDKIYNWNEIGDFSPSQYLIMHALIFKTEIVRESKVNLPNHTFYVDNIFASQPLPHVKSIYYIDVDLYQYFIGRDDQSVNEEMLKKRIDQQIKVTKMVSKCVDMKEVENMYPKLAKYMIRNISIMMAISSIHLLLIGSNDAIEKRKELWNYMKESDDSLYYDLRFKRLSGLTYLPGKLGRIVTKSGYQVLKKIYKFQ